MQHLASSQHLTIPKVAQSSSYDEGSKSGYLHILSGLTFEQINDSRATGSLVSDIAKETGLSSQDLANVLEIGKSKYYDLVKVSQLDQKYLDALADFSTLWVKGLEAFDNDQQSLLDFLKTKNENLGGIKPIYLLSSRMGRRELELAFQRIEYSLYG